MLCGMWVWTKTLLGTFHGMSLQLSTTGKLQLLLMPMDSQSYHVLWILTLWSTLALMLSGRRQKERKSTYGRKFFEHWLSGHNISQTGSDVFALILAFNYYLASYGSAPTPPHTAVKITRIKVKIWIGFLFP